MFDERVLDQAVDLIDMALMQSRKDRTFVGEILVDRANANPRNFGNAVSRNRAKTSRFRMRITASSTASTVTRARHCFGRRRPETLFALNAIV